MQNQNKNHIWDAYRESALPIDRVIPEIKEALKTERRVVIKAPPGAGKTTRIPLALLDEPWLENNKILLLEPRRLAARAAASRMAHLLNEPLGRTVGYHISMDRVVVGGSKTWQGRQNRTWHLLPSMVKANPQGSEKRDPA